MLSLMQEEAVRFCAELIRIDSTNTGDPASTGDGETRCAELIRDWLSELPSEWFERVPGRGNLVVSIPGKDPQLPRLAIHAHTDVVPADPVKWSVDPFAGEIRDGRVWGRGAVDMKDMIGMLVAAVRQTLREGHRPRRGIVLLFVADEEVEGANGMGFLVDEHPEVFRGVNEAIGEVGGFSVPTPTGDAYTIGIAEKGIAWATLRATGTEGHGSMVPNLEGAPARLVAALQRISEHEWPEEVDATASAVLTGLGSVLGVHVDPRDESGFAQALAPLGPVAGMFSNAFRTTAAITQVHAGSKTNTVPGEAIATVDCRIAPGRDEEFRRVFAELVGPGIEVTWETGQSVVAPYDTALVASMRAAVQAVQPDAQFLPFLTGGATDAKSLDRLGIACYGFVPLRLPPGFDFPGAFHGIDESVPVDALRTGSLILREFLLSQ
ncbi:M20/M25/M40 family metallo-hydrolase [Leucobacter edaphi]|nr:M20/M25/M40 family metallo-hydrolase [Leucobacter edaphi]